MNQIKIGKLIADCRKEKNMTQRQLADRLEISDKTISKWECGKGLPDASSMLPLCQVLDISVNELLSGERLTDAHAQEKAEETKMECVKEKEYTKTYRGLVLWMISFAVLALFFCYLYDSMEAAAFSVKVMLTAFILMVDFLFLDIYRGEFVYWITYGPDFHTARKAGTKARKKYAGQYLKTVLAATGIWILYMSGSILLDFSQKTDLWICLLLMVIAGLCTIRIKFTVE